jgi:hypothetical protein
MFYRGPGFVYTSTPPPSPVSNLDWRHTGRFRRETACPGRGEVGGPNQLGLRESPVLYKSFDALWFFHLQLSCRNKCHLNVYILLMSPPLAVSGIIFEMFNHLFRQVFLLF